MARVGIGSGHIGCRSFQFMIEFGFCSVMDRVTLGVQVQIDSSYFRCRFGYGSGSLVSDLGSWVSFARSSATSLEVEFHSE